MPLERCRTPCRVYMHISVDEQRRLVRMILHHDASPAARPGNLMTQFFTRA